MRIIGEPVFDDQGTLIGATVALIDIDREEELRRDKDLLIAELNHRVKNAFAVVKSIVAQSMRGADLPFDLRARLDARLDAYAKAHAALVGTTWDKASLQDVAKEVLEQVAGSRVKITGPAVGLPAKQALAFSMAFFELATNAFKYGALSGEDGEVMLSWSRETRAGISSLVVRWQEGGGPIVTEPNSTGFGSLIAGRVISLETEGTVEREFRPNGLFWKLTMPWPQEEAESR
jgi:two-component sensor histidine kinase